MPFCSVLYPPASVLSIETEAIFIFRLYAEKTQLKVKKGEPVTSGSVNVYRVHFDFSPDWEGMMKTACFRSGSQTVSVLLDGTGECTIPWEVTDPDDKG